MALAGEGRTCRSGLPVTEPPDLLWGECRYRTGRLPGHAFTPATAPNAENRMRRPTDQPNIILINCDDLGYGDIGCYGSTVHSTPALDRMAAEGLRFTDFYMASPVCSPSRGAMMTGCYPPRIGLGTNERGAG